jgi:hypothetical protein
LLKYKRLKKSPVPVFHIFKSRQKSWGQHRTDEIRMPYHIAQPNGVVSAEGGFGTAYPQFFSPRLH